MLVALELGSEVAFRQAPLFSLLLIAVAISVLRLSVELLQVLLQIGISVRAQLERGRYVLPDIVAMAQCSQQVCQMLQLLILWIVVVRNDGDPVVELEAKRVDRVVDEDQVLERSVADDSEVFDEDAFLGLEAVLSVESELDERLVWVNQVDDRVSILAMACCEYAHLVLCSALSQTLSQIGSQVDARLDVLKLLLEVSSRNVHSVLRLSREILREAWRLAVFSINTVGECLV